MLTWMRTATVIAVLAVSATLTACGSQSPTGTGAAGSPSRGTAKNSPAVVGLAAGFSPRTVRVRVGQQFLVAVSPNVRASGIPWPNGCQPGTTRPVAGGLLIAQCLAGGRYLYTARHPGSATVTATVRPRCAPGSICPQWMAEPRLTAVIS